MSVLLRVSPRDPLVLGDGRGMPALTSRLPNPVPPQPSLAGFVRTLATGSGVVTEEQARGALREIGVRGPFLVQGQGAARRIWLPAPLDAAGGGSDGVLVRARPLALAPGEGVSWSGGDAPPLLLHRPSKDRDGNKLRAPVRLSGWGSEVPALWPWDAALRWALHDESGAVEALAVRDAAGKKTPLGELKPPLQPEPRVHVALDDETGTAGRSLLFASSGWRYAEDVGLLVEVEGFDGRPPSTGLLGAESRLSRIHAEQDPLPEFPEMAYRTAWERMQPRGPLALRVQLLTPGCFGGWRPALPGGLPLLAVLLDTHGAVSGWNLQRREPRPVRRLVPAGSVYLFGPLEELNIFLELARELWLRPLDPGSPDPDQLLAAPGRDGFGLALPGLTLLSGVSHAR